MNNENLSDQTQPAVVQTIDSSDTSARRDVTKVLNTYFDALYDADSTKMGSIFHSRGVYATGDEVPALIRDKQTYLKVLAKRESPRSRGEARRDSIDSIEFAGANTARARVRCSIGASDFVDYLTLIRDEGRWQIVAKVFQIDR